MPLRATGGGRIDLATLAGLTVVYAYPRSGRPGVGSSAAWDVIARARGCTPQACAFRDHFADLRALGVARVFGLSTQDTADQREAAARLNLPFPLLSDVDLVLAHALDLPAFESAGIRLLKRFTLIIMGGNIEHVFYPVFPPDRNAAEVLAWLSHSCGSRQDRWFS